MDKNSWMAVFGKPYDQIRDALVAFLPNLVGALFILLIGILLAVLVRKLANRLFRNLGRLVPNRKIRARLQPASMERSANVFSKVLFWIIVFFFLTAATEILGLPVLTTWLSGIATYLPRALWLQPRSSTSKSQ